MRLSGGTRLSVGRTLASGRMNPSLTGARLDEALPREHHRQVGQHNTVGERTTRRDEPALLGEGQQVGQREGLGGVRVDGVAEVLQAADGDRSSSGCPARR